MTDNPYESPKSQDLEPRTAVDIEDLAKAQRFIIYALLLYFFGVLVSFVIPGVGLLLMLPALVMALVGIVTAMNHMGRHLFSKIVVVILMLIPLINLITLLIINSGITKRLKAAGYTIGFLGARKKSA